MLKADGKFRGLGQGEPESIGAAGGLVVGNVAQVHQDLGVQMGGIVEVHGNILLRREPAPAAHNVQQHGVIRLSQASGDFQGHPSGINIHTDQHTQLMVQGFSQ
ncbi:hypothetical protein D9M72_485690 [compost metagenome]